MSSTAALQNKPVNITTEILAGISSFFSHSIHHCGKPIYIEPGRYAVSGGAYGELTGLG